MIKLKLDDGREYSFSQEQVIIGRVDSCDVVINHESISRNHAKLIKDAQGRYCLSDLDSANGTFLNNEELPKGNFYRIEDGDVLGFGDIDIQAKLITHSQTNTINTISETTTQALEDEYEIPLNLHTSDLNTNLTDESINLDELQSKLNSLKNNSLKNKASLPNKNRLSFNLFSKNNETSIKENKTKEELAEEEMLRKMGLSLDPPPSSVITNTENSIKANSPEIIDLLQITSQTPSQTQNKIIDSETSQLSQPYNQDNLMGQEREPSNQTLKELASKLKNTSNKEFIENNLSNSLNKMTQAIKTTLFGKK